MQPVPNPRTTYPERRDSPVHQMVRQHEPPLKRSTAMKTMTTQLSTALFAAIFALGTTPALSQSQAPTDAQIAGIVVTANTVDIDAGKLAEKMSGSKDVKAFAKQMVTDHSGVNKQASELVKKLKIKPEGSDTSKSLKDGGDANLAKLKGLKGKEFDKAYVDNEVTYHQAVIDALDKTLIPNAKNAELKDTLVKVRPAFVAHLEHAKHLQSSMK
jgi:putative membrane protein